MSAQVQEPTSIWMLITILSWISQRWFHQDFVCSNHHTGVKWLGYVCPWWWVGVLFPLLVFFNSQTDVARWGCKPASSIESATLCSRYITYIGVVAVWLWCCSSL